MHRRKLPLGSTLHTHLVEICASTRLRRNTLGSGILAFTIALVFGPLAAGLEANPPCIVDDYCSFGSIPPPGPRDYEANGDVDIDGDVMAVVVRLDDAPGQVSERGAIHVYRYDGAGWLFEATLLPSDMESSPYFGTSVSVSGDRIAVGTSLANYTSSHDGAVYVFQRNSGVWSQQARMTSPIPSFAPYFGWRAAISGDSLIVSAPCNAAGPCSGVFGFHFDGANWGPGQLLKTGEWSLGLALAADGNRAAVSEMAANLGGCMGCGAIDLYQFAGGEWNFETRLTGSQQQSGRRLGISMDLEGDRLVAGTETGKLHVFDRGVSWAETDVLQPSIPLYVFGGDAVALDGTLVVMSGYDDPAVVFQFDGTAWNELALIDALGLDFKGKTALGHGLIPIWSHHNPCSLPPGECFLLAQFDLESMGVDCDCDGTSDSCEIAAGLEGDCNGNASPDSCDIAEGTSADCNDDGTPDECESECNGSGVPDDCDINNGTSLDCNGSAVPDECELLANDCNGNNVPDECDAAVVNADCDGNGLPDECDIDCQPNGVPDACDLAGGTSMDVNLDGIPDECPALLIGAEPAGVPKVRFISFIVDPASAGQLTAIRVVLTAMAQPHLQLLGDSQQPAVGQVRYVNRFVDGQGQPTLICPGSVSGTTFYCATLGCTAEYRDWAAELGGGVVHLTESFVVPSSEFRVSLIASSCMGAEANCLHRSADLDISTTKWGDVSFDGGLNVIDLGRTVDSVKGLATSLPEYLTKVNLQNPDPIGSSVNVIDIGGVTDALRNIIYPHSVDLCP